MEDNFKLRAALKSDDELFDCIDNREKYLPESVEAALEELQSRGAEFSDEELRVIKEDMQARREIAETETNTFSVFGTGWNINQVEDPDAPVYFSKQAIFLFSVLFSMFFGAILMAINVAKTPNKDKTIWVALYGLGFTVIQVLINQTYNLGPLFTLITSIFGANAMQFLFWNKYIGVATLYRARPVWVPLIIGLAIAIPFVIAAVYYGKF